MALEQLKMRLGKVKSKFFSLFKPKYQKEITKTLTEKTPSEKTSLSEKEHLQEEVQEDGNKLLRTIFEAHPSIKTVWEHAIHQGTLKEIMFDNHTSMSGVKEGVITIGMKKDTSGTIYYSKSFEQNDTNELAYKLAHELMHLVVYEQRKHKEIQGLLAQMKGARKDTPQLGLSMLVSHFPKLYTTEKTRATEDLVELCTMYLISPQYLKEYLDWISTGNRKDFGLVEVSPQLAEDIYTKIDSVLSSVVKTETSIQDTAMAA